MDTSPNNENPSFGAGVGVLDKVMAILSEYGSGTEVLDPPTVSHRLGLAPSTAYRLMKAMAHHGILRPVDGGYRLGIALLSLGAKVADGLELRGLARPHLETVAKSTGENAELQVRIDDYRVSIDVVLSEQNIRPIVEVGVQLPLHVGAGAHALLAWLDPTEAASLAERSAVRFEDAQGFDGSSHERRLGRVRQRGWAESVAERAPEVASVAAPIVSRTGTVIAALVLSGPEYRLGARARAKVAGIVCQEAEAASIALGAEV